MNLYFKGCRSHLGIKIPSLLAALNKFDLVVRIPDDADIGVAVYNASPKMEETKIFTGRTGNSAVRIKEAYVRFYDPKDICELHLNGGYADWFVEETIRPFCEKYGILLYR